MYVCVCCLGNGIRHWKFETRGEIVFLGTALEWVFQVRLGIQKSPIIQRFLEMMARGGSVHGGTVGTQSNGGRRTQLKKVFQPLNYMGFCYLAGN